MPKIFQATASAPVNIACIKYWGKRDTKLILPTNSSLSVTLNQDHLRSTTTSRADPSFTEDTLWLNGQLDEIKPGGRLATCISEMKRLRKELEDANPDAEKELSLIARQGSGSACRSLFGGFVAWREGIAADGSDSFAEQIASEVDWPDMHALICVVSDDKKGTSSTAGMQRTVETSALFSHPITMKDSNQFHAVALDTDPPIFYMNDVSRAIITVVTEYNRVALEKGGKRKAAYTFDAGPNAAKRFGTGAVKTLIHTCVGDGPRVRGDEESLLGSDGLPKTLT
ncbi:GHMP kinase, partial [Butyriboletus roseoflavus]